jgi:exonuclease III
MMMIIMIIIIIMLCACLQKQGTNSHLSLVSLNITGLNSPIKRNKLTDWICKQDPAFFCIQETYLSNKDSHYLRVNEWKRVFQAYGPRKQAGDITLISNKIDFQPKVIKCDEEGHFIFIKGKIHQETISMPQMEEYPHS